MPPQIHTFVEFGFSLFERFDVQITFQNAILVHYEHHETKRIILKIPNTMQITIYIVFIANMLFFHHINYQYGNNSRAFYDFRLIYSPAFS